MAKTIDEMKWFNLWCEDRQSILTTMRRNLQADLDAGYAPDSINIREQEEDIEYEEEWYDRWMERFKTWEPKHINHWCYLDLKKRGAIE